LKVFFLNFNGDHRAVFLAALARQKGLVSLKFFQKKADEPKKLAQAITAKWRQGKTSTLNYLLKLNKYAGRSYNDLSQYPVVPWVIGNYTSPEIDLTCPKSYRDLSCPLGAMTEDRFEPMLERFKEGFDPETRYMYGSMYSSAAVVIGYLIRMEPFTSLHITLQSGKFDYADRLFHSIPEAWNSVQNTQMDFRELIPEFFTIPDFLVNANHFNLGKLISGEFVDNVVLPAWAKSPRHFIEVNRRALESSYVSEHIHSWIDLIFGPSARFPLFEAARNVFHPYFYESMLTPEVMADARLLSVIREYAACFGAVPAQVLDERPPERDEPEAIPRSFAFNIVASMESRFVCLDLQNSNIVAVDDSLRFVMFDQNSDTLKGSLSLPAPRSLLNVRPIVAMSRKFAIACYPWSRAFDVFFVKNGQCTPFRKCATHTRPITSLAICDRYFVSASQDCILALWELRDQSVQQIQYLTKHTQPIVFVRMSPRMKQAISISKDGFLLSMSLLDGRYLHGISLNADPSELTVSDRGYIAVAFNGPDSHVIIVLDQNLNVITEKAFDGCVLCCATVDRRGLECLVIALNNGTIVAYQLPFLEKKTLEVAVDFTVSFMSFGKNGLCYLAASDGKIRTCKLLCSPPE
jgi:hypothetical protein